MVDALICLEYWVSWHTEEGWWLQHFTLVHKSLSLARSQFEQQIKQKIGIKYEKIRTEARDLQQQQNYLIFTTFD